MDSHVWFNIDVTTAASAVDSHPHFFLLIHNLGFHFNHVKPFIFYF